MQITCPLGHTFHDDDSKEIHLAPEASYEAALSYLSNELAGLLAPGVDRKDWLRSHFRKEYPTHFSLNSIIYDFISDVMAHYKSRAFECPDCGALVIEIGSTRLEGYVPSTDRRPHLVDSLIAAVRSKPKREV